MDANEVFRMAFTSGTTGDPKCVLHSFNTTIYAPWLLNRDMMTTEHDVLLIYLPIGLNWGYITLMQTILAGARAVLMERFSARAALEPSKVNGTIGRVVGDMELRIIDSAGGDLPCGEIGEVVARGPSVHLGYHNNAAANAASFTKDGWLPTGDLGRFVDESGNVQLSGRSKEIINRGGKKFFPREVEEILYTHPAILHAAMVGVPDARLGERNCLCIIPKPGREVSLDDAVNFLKGQIADYKLPETIERFEEFPMTGTGKVRRHVLREWVMARHEPPRSA